MWSTLLRLGRCLPPCLFLLTTLLPASGQAVVQSIDSAGAVRSGSSRPPAAAA